MTAYLIGRIIGGGIVVALIGALIARFTKKSIPLWGLGGLLIGMAASYFMFVQEQGGGLDRAVHNFRDGCLSAATETAAMETAQAEAYCGCMADRYASNQDGLREAVDGVAQAAEAAQGDGARQAALADPVVSRAILACSKPLFVQTCSAGDLVSDLPEGRDHEAFCACVHDELAGGESGLPALAALAQGTAGSDDEDPAATAALAACKAAEE
ncbi:MAG: hypothetical protein ACFCVH_01635 [Alphaproteobacteria bacterium]